MSRKAFQTWVIALLLGVAAPRVRGDASVASDGSGDFRTVQAAIDAAPQLGLASPLWVIHIKAGTYREMVYVQREKRGIRLAGDSAATTTISYDLNARMPDRDGRPIGTFRTPTLWIDADDFTVEDLTVANTAGAVGQALAVRVDGDRVVFRRCHFLGWQDTILGNRGRHYYQSCLITGAVDFIFGAATEFFQSCRIECRGNGYITAASTPSSQSFGFVFADCQIWGDSPTVRTYLGRPWRANASAIFLHTTMSEVVRPAGWDNWRDPAREKTARYAEFASTGPGAQPAARVPWAHQLTADQAAAITPRKVLGGSDGWDPTAATAK
jgi:pectinesterase